MRLDLGSGSRPRPGFFGVDIVPDVADHTFDLMSGHRWPWADSSVDELASSHFIEHIPAMNICRISMHDGRRVRLGAQDALFWFFDEAFRIAKPGALFYLSWPALRSVWAFQDPTHRRFIPMETLHYLSKAGRRELAVEHYEVACNWSVVSGSMKGKKNPSSEAGGWNEILEYEVTLYAEK